MVVALHAKYPAGEVKHGPIALGDEQCPVAIVGEGTAPRDDLLQRRVDGRTQRPRHRDSQPR